MDLSLFRCGKGENEWFMQKKSNDLGYSFNEIAFLIDLWSDYTNLEWFDNIKFMSIKEN